MAVRSMGNIAGTIHAAMRTTSFGSLTRCGSSYASETSPQLSYFCFKGAAIAVSLFL